MRDQAYKDVEMAKEKLMRGEIPLRDASQGRKALGKQLIDGGCILLNIASTVTLVFLNKWHVFEDGGLESIY
jgi:solute carrier family 35 protein E3